MTARPFEVQEALLGFENPAGEPAPTNLKTTMGRISVTPQSEQKEIKAQGDLFNSLIVPTKHWSEWAIEGGFPCFSHLTYWLAMVYGRPTVELLGPDAFEYTYSMTRNTADMLTATLALGDETQAMRVTRAVMAGLTLAWNTQSGDSEMAAAGFAGKVDMAHAITGTSTRLVPSPVLPDGLTVSVAGSLSALQDAPAVKDNAYAVQLEISDRAKTFTTFGAEHTLLTAPGATFTLNQLADADSIDWFRKFREAERGYARVHGFGAELATAEESVSGVVVREELDIQVCFQAGQVPSIGNDDDAYTVTTEGTVVTDPNGFESTIRIVSSVPPLAAWTV